MDENNCCTAAPDRRLEHFPRMNECTAEMTDGHRRHPDDPVLCIQKNGDGISLGQETAFALATIGRHQLLNGSTVDRLQKRS